MHTEDDLTPLEMAFFEITQQSWFHPSARYAFSQYLVDAFPDGAFDPEKHRDRVEEYALSNFAISKRTAQMFSSIDIH